MKKKLTKFLSVIMLLTGFGLSSHAQSLSFSGTLYLPQDSIEFSYESPSFTATDWIGIYGSDEAPGTNSADAWSYIPDAAGTIKIAVPQTAEWFRAFLLANDGYDTIAIAADTFQVAIPVLEPSAPVYAQGDSMVFEYVSPKFTSTDWIGLYHEGDIPGDVGSISYEYLPDSAGIMVFKTSLSPGNYYAFMGAEDGYDSISACSFVIVEGTAATGTLTMNNAGSLFLPQDSIEFTYYSSNFSDTDWIGIYGSDEAPGTNSADAWSYIPDAAGTMKIAPPQEAGWFRAFLLCCDGYDTLAVIPDTFQVAFPVLEPSADTFAVGDSLVFEYVSPKFTSTDWIGLYHEDDTVGVQGSITYEYLPDSAGTMVFKTDLTEGNYYAFMGAEDGYDSIVACSFVVVEATGIRSIEERNGIVLYPNPSSGLITISLEGGEYIREIAVYSLDGKAVYKKNLAEMISETSFDLDFLPKGLYIIGVQAGNKTRTSKLILR